MKQGPAVAPMNPHISVIVPAYNARAVIGECLEALDNQTAARQSYETIVVDDGSTDGTSEVAQQFKVRLIKQVNAGPAAARNRGAEAARGDLLLFTDADCRPASDWIERMREPFFDPQVTGVKGVYQTRQRNLVARFVQLEYEFKYRRLAHQERIDFIDTYSAGYRRDVFFANGGFDTLFPTASVEDAELAFRLARKGYWLMFAPAASVYHLHDTTLGEYWRRKFSYGYWRALLYRWHPQRAVRDSHTPPTQKAQIGLAGLLCLAIPIALVWAPARWLTLALSALFLISAAPFWLGTIRRDVKVALIAPLCLIWRAMALGTGLVAGIFAFYLKPSPRKPPLTPANQVIKRALDIAGSATGLVLAGPAVATVAFLGRRAPRRHAFSAEDRVGKHGRIFSMLRMNIGPKQLERLPQLWNVLRGDMSLVGPQPDRPEEAQCYTDWHRKRLAVKPGLFAPMPPGSPGDVGIDERVQMELEYIARWSLWKDLRALGRGIASVSSARDNQ